MSPERIDLIERDVLSHARVLSEFTAKISGIQEHLTEYEKAKAIEEIKDGYLEKRITGIEKKIDAIFRLGVWILAAIGGIFVSAVANFVINGGLVVAQ